MAQNIYIYSSSLSIFLSLGAAALQTNNKTDHFKNRKREEAWLDAKQSIIDEQSGPKRNINKNKKNKDPLIKIDKKKRKETENIFEKLIIFIPRLYTLPPPSLHVVLSHFVLYHTALLLLLPHSFETLHLRRHRIVNQPWFRFLLVARNLDLFIV